MKCVLLKGSSLFRQPISRSRPSLSLLCGLSASSLIASVLAQSLVPQLFRTYHLFPNLPVIIVVFLSFHFPMITSCIISFMIGLGVDLCSGGLIGPWAGALVLLFYVCSLASSHIFLDSLWPSALVAGIGCLLCSVAYLCIQGQLSTEPLFNNAGSLAISALVTGGIAPFIFPVLRRLASVNPYEQIRDLGY